MNEAIIEMSAPDRLPFLYGMYRWGIDVIRVIQRIESPWLTALIKGITALGTEALYLPLILFIFWWVDEKRGLRFGILILISAWINSVAKDLLKQPRPYNFEPSLGLAVESSYGAPSGHAQMSLSFWIPMAVWLGEVWAKKKRLIWAGAIFFILLIGFTRLYLGVHFPTDLFAGWILGGAVLVLWFIPGPRLEKLITSAGPRIQSILAAIAALIMNGLYPKDRTLPALLLGFCLGYVLMKQRFPFSARGEIKGKRPGLSAAVLRCVIGLAGMAVIYLALRLILPGEGSIFRDIPSWGAASSFYELGRFIRYGLLGLWASAGAPRIFQRMGLAPDTAVQAENTDSGISPGSDS